MSEGHSETTSRFRVSDLIRFPILYVCMWVVFLSVPFMVAGGLLTTLYRSAKLRTAFRLTHWDEVVDSVKNSDSTILVLLEMDGPPKYLWHVRVPRVLLDPDDELPTWAGSHIGMQPDEKEYLIDHGLYEGGCVERDYAESRRLHRRAEQLLSPHRFEMSRLAYPSHNQLETVDAKSLYAQTICLLEAEFDPVSS